MIAIWGSRESGKTTFIQVLYYEIVKRQQENGSWKMYGADDDGYSARFIEAGYRTLIAEQQFPARTGTDNLRALRFKIERPLDYQYEEKGSTRATAVRGLLGRLSALIRRGMGSRSQDDIIDLLDPAGEFFTSPNLLETDAGLRYREALTQCDGLVCLVDPMRQDGSSHYFPLLFRNFAILARLMRGEGNPGPLPIPVAVCVTKVDRIEELQVENPSAEDFLRRHMGAVDFSVFPMFCDNVRYFATTAMGVDNVQQRADGNWRPTRAPSPRNVFEPIEWLMSQGARPQ